MTTQEYLEVSQAAGAAFFSQNIEGPVTMLNLLRFREVADYSAHPELIPDKPISGAAAYQKKYIEYTMPFLQESGGELLFLGKGGRYLIGPQEAQWDLMMLVRQKSVSDFMAFSNKEDYLIGLGHRTAALADSRLLPLVETETAT